MSDVDESATKRPRDSEGEDYEEEPTRSKKKVTESQDEDFEEEGEGKAELFVDSDSDEQEINDDDDDDDSDGNSGPETCGKIKRISCVDFMCHKKLTVDLNTHINFITGPNGSGKSAIIAALQICLGMSARQTQRGGQLKSLIRHGSRGDAYVTVSLYNGGREAFRPEEFGNTIVVERTLKRSGGSSYRLMNAENKVVTTKRAVLDEVIRYFQICVDNPCCILDQETSKSFLRGTNKEKYSVFLSSTNLKDMKGLYDYEQKKRTEAKTVLKQEKANLELDRQDVALKEDRLNELGYVDQLRGTLDTFMKQKSWALANVLEQSRVEIAEKLVAIEQKRDERALQLKKAEEVTASSEPTRIKLCDELDALDKECLAIKEDFRRKTNDVNEAKRVAKQDLAKVKTQEAQINQYKEQETDWKEELHELLATSGDAKRLEEERERSRKIEETEQSILVAEQEKDSAGSQLDQLRDDATGAQTDMENAKRAREEEQKNCKAKEASLRQLEAMKKDADARFGTFIPDLIREIDNNKHRFSKKPEHIGLNTRLHEKYSSWWKPVEHHLGPMLKAFIMNDRKDITEFRRICSKLKIQMIPRVVTMKFTDRRHDTANGPAKELQQRGLLTIDDVLEIDNPNVYNALVDQSSIESIVLARDYAEAKQIAFAKNSNGGLEPPRGMSKCLDLNADAYSVRNGSEYKQASHGTNNGSLYFTSGSGSALDEETLRKEIAVCVQNLDQAERLLREAEAKFKTAQAAEKNTEKRLTQTQRSLYRLRKALDTLKEEEAEAKAEMEDGDGMEDIQKQRLQEDIENARAAIEKGNETLKRYQAAAQKSKKTVDEKKAVADVLEEKLQTALTASNNKEEELAVFNDSIKTACTREMDARRRLEKFETALETVRAQAEEAKLTAESARQGALEYCDNQEFETNGKSVAYFSKKIESCEQEIEKERRKIQETNTNGATIDEIIIKARAERDRAKKKYVTRKKTIKVQSALVKKFKSSHRKREDGWDDFRATCQARMGMLFRAYLSHRDHAGDVVFNDEKQELDFTWQKSGISTQDLEQDGQGQTKDAGSLSGGEKSFTTLAFLIAMGELVKSPFRVMDEFDVFMDSSNRKVSLELLIQTARNERAKDKQFIFITPHDISMVPDGADIKKQAMKPPSDEFGSRTSQSTLNFQTGSAEA
uniref:RecF/RecN/SMC N-terminal domain-containing protein n=1 Tax=Mucochytrium quahogii TaxID=96639 RepID=A0A7S2WJD2_9STRA|mmetsp:Transcript_9619/g.18124  ORF Transcript_9619/g.18124 Transcript_9619/m.18124 type:complete len:1174 (+) Transcript_9619:199-3720(+)|eukprot:CAMPEP_0203762664 /NCGR_PEP_ID=MMETSP0098-20131031/15498_1 /ASSEMBLY_ACC=CAM_ASM_000208 /TAXON_ID=96639 /ORGANISM=" , Strain NY0313808BC1" /LENGTH=1173 /DNA_ID=CAMNT_0050657159 /DNA_START=168 /DNA_END=3689 /DNA_ORIENTATION=+